MKIHQLQEALEKLAGKHVRAELLKNEIGNLAVVLDEQYIGFLDLTTGELVLFDD